MSFVDASLPAAYADGREKIGQFRETIMSETLFRFLLTELKTARVICRRCNGVLEVAIEQVGSAFAIRCPLCNKEFRMAHQPNPVAEFGKAVQGLKAMAELLELEFALPIKGEVK
jgi:hypothetical protein